jgi:molybdopterin/thiamine biosynthesis adenylyltransferase
MAKKGAFVLFPFLSLRRFVASTISWMNSSFFKPFDFLLDRLDKLSERFSFSLAFSLSLSLASAAF